MAHRSTSDMTTPPRSRGNAENPDLDQVCADPVSSVRVDNMWQRAMMALVLAEGSC